MTANPRFRNQLAYLLEGIALIAENYNNIANMDNVSIYETKNDRFMVIEGSNKLYATLLASNRHPAWTINENAVDALTFIKSKTNVNISENYAELVKTHIEAVSEAEQETIKQELHEQTIQSYKERIEMLTEKFKNDPTKLAVLSNIAQELMNVEE
jgi:flagellar biosynthesis component FlhA